MNKQEFLSALENSMGQFPKNTVDDTLHYYQELIEDRMEDGMCEEDAVGQLDSIDYIVSAMSTELPMSTIVKNKFGTMKTKKSEHNTLWIILAICGFPIWLPLGISFIAVGFSIYVTIWALIASLFCILISFAGTAILGIMSGFIYFFQGSPVVGLTNIAFSIMCAGFFFMLVTPSKYFVIKLVKLTKQFVRFVKKLIIGKKGGTSINE